MTTNNNNNINELTNALNVTDINTDNATTSSSSTESTTSSTANAVSALTSLSSSAQSALQSLLPNADPQKLLAMLQNRLHGNTQQHEYKFWSTQPVPKFEEEIPDSEIGPIETKTVDQVLKNPYPLPKSFEWSTIDMTNLSERQEVYKLLSENYVEDDDAMFRFDYSAEFLEWALMSPGYLKEFHIGVRTVTANATQKKLVGFISATPQHIRVHNHELPMVEVNYLCVHKKLRSKRLAPVLIKEVTRRVNLTNVWQAAYTAGVVLPRPIASNRYYHRSINPKKLIEIGFSRLQPRMTMTRTIKLYKLPNIPYHPSIRPMIEADVPMVHKLLTSYLKKFKVAPMFTEDEIRHWLLPRKDVIYSYVVTDASKNVTEFCSFYCLPSQVLNHPAQSPLRAAYSFYNVATKSDWSNLMSDALLMAQQNGFDVFNALNVMENNEFLSKLKFGIGDGQLQYYVYNWRCPEMNPGDVGLVLL
jgi:glycylpeptide N-tetradecanoyltransferase